MDAPARGAWNMAVDEAIACAIAANQAPPTLRLYSWQPPCLSLGRHQAITEIDMSRCAAQGVDIVRRPTGGRAILHTDELTYSVIATPHDPLVAGAVLDAYHKLSFGLLQGLRSLGVQASEAPATNRAGSDVSAACFEVPSAYEIMAAGRKLMGGAQCRRANWVLQHGSLPLVGDITRIVDYLQLSSDIERAALRKTLAAHATTVQELLGCEIAFVDAARAMAQGFAEALDIGFVPGVLSQAETESARDMMQEKYGNMEWTARLPGSAAPAHKPPE
jgi:lipoyl(octanoyl) transferase